MTCFWGWSPDLASNGGLGPLHLIAAAQDGNPPGTRPIGPVASANSREGENAAALKHRSRRRDALMHLLGSGTPVVMTGLV
jgi:hypothetical protein